MDMFPAVDTSGKLLSFLGCSGVGGVVRQIFRHAEVGSLLKNTLSIL